MAIPLRLARETIFQLECAEQHERLAEVLALIPIFLPLFNGEDRSNILELWQKLTLAGREPEQYFPASIERIRNGGSSLLPDALVTASQFFEARGAYDMSIEFLTELLAWAEARKDETSALQTHYGLGSILWHRGDYVPALTHSVESLRVAESLGDNSGASRAIGSLGIVHMQQGRYAEAMASYERQLAMAESLGDKSGMARAIGNMGNIHGDQGRLAEAMECFNRHLALAESLGDKSGMSIAIGNMGIVHRQQGRDAEAIECYERHLAIGESLGDKSGMMRAIGNMGVVRFEQGRYAEAMKCCERHLAIAESLEDKSGMSRALGNLGNVHRELGRHEESFTSFRSSREIARSIGSFVMARNGAQNLAAILLDLATSSKEVPAYLAASLPDQNADDCHAGVLNLAREYAEECMAIARQNSLPDSFFAGKLILARIDAAEGNAAGATQKLEAMLADTKDENERAELHYWLWRSRANSNSPAPSELEFAGTHRREALRLYESLYAKTPKFEFKKRIAELKGERIPMSADDR